MRRLFEDLDRLVGISDPTEQMLEQDPIETALAFVPRVDVRQQNDRLLVHVDLPGLSPNDVRVRVDPDSLVIEGERKQEREMNEGGVVRTERLYGRFQRIIPLPDHADLDSIDARFENGVLEISVKAPQPRDQGRQVPIKSGGQTLGTGEPSKSSETTKH
jgi:HSP20 family protein